MLAVDGSGSHLENISQKVVLLEVRVHSRAQDLPESIVLTQLGPAVQSKFFNPDLHDLFRHTAVLEGGQEGGEREGRREV